MMTPVFQYTYGCTNSLSLNYDPQANTDDYSCENVLYGCTDINSLNYNYLANTDDGTCIQLLRDVLFLIHLIMIH